MIENDRMQIEMRAIGKKESRRDYYGPVTALIKNLFRGLTLSIYTFFVHTHTHTTQHNTGTLQHNDR